MFKKKIISLVLSVIMALAVIPNGLELHVSAASFAYDAEKAITEAKR